MEIKIRISDDWLKRAWKGARTSQSAAPRALRRGAYYLLGLAVFLVVGIGAAKMGLVRQEARAREAELAAGPLVRTAKVTRSPAHYEVNVIGEARPYAEVTLYAKVSGYLKSVAVDKGDSVKAGQALARIEASETDKDYAAAAADAKNKRKIADRIQKLSQRNLVSAQEVEQAQADAEISEAKLGSIAVMKDYETLRAPFAGTVTARFADPGSLVQNAANSQTSALPVVTVSQVNHLRVYAYLDQKDARYVRKGDSVEITMADHPGFARQATVSRLAGSLDERTRMLLTEIDLDNKDGDIVPGSFVQVKLQINRPAYLQAPAESLVLADGKSLIATVTNDKKLKLKPVEVAENDGRNVGVREGVDEGETVALNPGPIPDGSPVRPEAAEGKK